MPDLSRLTPEQRQVALAADGPLLVIAGPGSGKTTALAARIAHLVDGRGFAPSSVLAITFTTAAASTLRRRLEGLLGEAGTQVDAGTFHALGLRIVRHWAGALGFPDGGPRVCPPGVTRTLLARAAAACGADSGNNARTGGLDALAAAVERHRLSIGSVPMGAAAGEGGQGAGTTAEPVATVCRVAAAYEALLYGCGQVDFAGMLGLPLRLFAAQPAALRFCQDLYRAVVADEVQDLCAAQYALLRLLAARHRNVLAVGDPRQTIYGWRGADPSIFDAFRRDFPDARVLSLDQSFRCTARLVRLANALGGALGHPGSLWTQNPEGSPALVYAARDEADEAAFVAGEVLRLLAGGVILTPGDAAVLYRTNAQLRVLEGALRSRGLASRVLAADGEPAGADGADGVAGQNGTTGGHEDTPTARDSRAVALATVHAAKGCEWPVVFVVGVEEGLLPHVRASAVAGTPPAAHPATSPATAAGPGDAGLMEELRVAYVAVTRPRLRLYLSYCRSRSRGAWRASRAPSRFLGAVPSDLLRPVGPAPEGSAE